MSKIVDKTETPSPDETPAWPKSLEWEGKKFTITDPKDWSIGTLRAFELGREVDAIARVIGDAAWSQIEDLPASRAVELFKKIAETAGFAGTGE